MIGHFLEVWGLLLVAFVAGCVLGTLAYMAIAASPWANAQIETADAIEEALDGFRFRLRRAGETVPMRRRTSEMQPPVIPATQIASTFDSDGWAAPEPGLPVPGGETSTGHGSTDPVEPGWDTDGHDAEPEHPVDETTASGAEAVDEEAGPAMPASVDSQVPAPELLPELPAMRPLTLPGPRNGVPDDLQRIRGIGLKNEELLNSLGVYHFGQIAAWTPAEARWVAEHLAFPDRIERDDWVGQAIILATGGDTGYVKSENRRKREETAPA